MPEICRMCSENSVLLVPMVKSTNIKDELEEIGARFEDCFGIKVLATPDHTSICSLCHKKLCCFYEFKQKVLKTHKKLLQHYKGVIIAEKDIKIEILDDLDVEYFEDDATCLMFQKLVEEANLLPMSSHRSINGPSSSAPLKEPIKVESVSDSPGVILPKQTVIPRQIPSPIVKIEGLKEKMISLRKAGEKKHDKEEEEEKENEYDDDDDEFDEIQDDELEEIERISTRDIDKLLNVEDFNPDEILEDENNKESKDGKGTFRCYKCHVCKQMFRNKTLFEHHMLKYEQQQKEESSSPSSLELKKHKTTKYKINCDQCDKTFALEETLKAHMNTHKGLPAYSCNICGKGFNVKDNFVYHMKNHNNERRFICEICSKAFLIKGDLSKHMRCHSDERPYVCHICGQGYKLLSNLNQHTETHIEENLNECEICKKKFHTPQILRRHTRKCHDHEGGDPRLYCTLCKKQFNRRYRYINHLKSKHPDESEEMISKVQYRTINRFPLNKKLKT